MNTHIFAGTYTLPGFGPEKLGKGIYVFNFSEETGELYLQNCIEDIVNPSFLQISGNGKMMYCVNEMNDFQNMSSGAITAFKIDDAGSFIPIETKPSFGTSPCYILPDFKNNLLYITNYFGGNVCVYALNEDGSLGSCAVSKHNGKSIHPERQEQPHPHSIVLTKSGKYAITCDLGLDKLIVYAVIHDEIKPVLMKKAETALPAGSGPRMAVFHPVLPLLFAINELNSTITLFSCNEEGIPEKSIKTISALPLECSTEGNVSADIRFSTDGRFLYVSNRGHNSISVFSINEKNGDLKLIQNISSGGTFPRSFTISPSNNWLLAANQNSGNISIFKIERETGLLEYQNSVDVPAPVCLQCVIHI